MAVRPMSAPGARSPVRAVLSRCRTALLALGLFSLVINLLALTGSLFMMQVYDRVLGSQSSQTLVALSVIAIVAYAFQGFLEMVRGRALALIGERIDGEIGPNVYDAMMQLPLKAPGLQQESVQPFRDLDSIRSFISGPGPSALFDLPWLPLYLGFIWLLHPMLFWLCAAGALFQFIVALVTDRRSAAPMRRAMEAQSIRNLEAESAQRGIEAAQAMGIHRGLSRRWLAHQRAYLNEARRAGLVVGTLSALARTVRMVLQSAVLGLGAYLAIKGEITAGSIIAASILASRALAPVDQAIASWNGFVAARRGYVRVSQLLAAMPPRPEGFELSSPKQSLIADAVTIAPPGEQRPIVRTVTFGLKAGQSLGIIGPSGAGKSTLAKSLVGVWPPLAGKVLLDGAPIDQWHPDRLGPSIGYLPHDVQLFTGTVAENIARFTDGATSASIEAAAKAASFHDHVLRLPQGYDTRIGAGGHQLSAGQRQRLGLARALYGNPFLVVLDEPNSNLDGEGEQAVLKAVMDIRQRGGIAIVVAHRPSMLAVVDLLLEMRDGAAVQFAPRDDVLKRLQAQRTKQPQPGPPGAATPPAEPSRVDTLKVVQ
jgi:ATP-binding cassette subfamily C protein